MSVAVDPHTKAILDETRRDHAKAAQRGERIAALTETVLNALMATGRVRGLDASLRPVLFHVLCDDIYGNAAIDIPEWKPWA